MGSESSKGRVGWSVGRPVGGSAGRLVGGSAGRPVGESAGRSVLRSKIDIQEENRADGLMGILLNYSPRHC